ncbi:MAG: fucose isomerase [Planctomycetaceae bacterium]|nr:MAG: fucose isomerase [Planctomycetaceae bacterium]
MLRGLSPLLSPELMAVLLRMGHGDDLVLADGNFPAESLGQRVIRADGHGVLPLLQAIAPLFPLDDFVTDAVKVMQPVSGPEPSIWTEYRRILTASAGRTVTLVPVERYAFYEAARRAFAVVATSDTALYANLLLKKGVIRG